MSGAWSLEASSHACAAVSAYAAPTGQQDMQMVHSRALQRPERRTATASTALHWLLGSSQTRCLASHALLVETRFSMARHASSATGTASFSESAAPAPHSF